MLAPHKDIAPRSSREEALLELLDRLWDRYRGRVRHARAYEELLERRGGRFRNDHVAFRAVAWQRPAAGGFCVSRLFEALGYRAAGAYEFPDKKLASVHLEHGNPAFPKLFVSELKLWELSPAAQRAAGASLAVHRPLISLETVSGLCEPVSPGARKRLVGRAFAELSQRPWPAPQRRDVLRLNAESQFGAWVLLHGYEVNHFTASVDAQECPTLAGIDRTAAALREAGVPMKREIEGAPGSPLRQTATEAVSLEAEAREGRKRVALSWPYAYFELAERPLIEGRRFEGFLGGQAANLFDMTRRPPNG